MPNDPVSTWSDPIFTVGRRIRLLGMVGLTALSLWGVVHYVRGDDHRLLAATGILWGAFGIILTTIRVIHRSPERMARFLTGDAALPPRAGFSAIEALVARGETARAAEAYFDRSADPEHGVEAMLRRAELLAGPLAQPEAAARDLERFRADRDTLHPADEIRIGWRLLDLYDGPLADPGQAMVEARRLLDRFPDNTQAPALRRMLQALRADHFGAAHSDPRP